MGRKSIYSQEFKMKCVQDHIDGLPYSQIIKENGLSKNDLNAFKIISMVYLIHRSLKRMDFLKMI